MDRLHSLGNLHKEIIADLQKILAISDPAQLEKAKTKILALINAIESGLYDTPDSLTRMSGQLGDIFH